MFKLFNLFRKVTNFVDPDLDPIKLTKATLMFFRARVVTQKMKETFGAKVDQSWQQWFAMKKPSGITDEDIEKIQQTLSSNKWDPDRLMELYRQVVSSTNGVPNTIVRASVCHALSSELTSHESMNRIFDHFLTVEEVEDGELLSESEDEETPGSLSN
jgi:hypothetical protein